MRTSSHQPRIEQRSARDAAIIEADRFLEAGERVLADALVFGDDFELREAGEHMVVMTARARRFLEFAA